METPSDQGEHGHSVYLQIRKVCECDTERHSMPAGVLINNYQILEGSKGLFIYLEIASWTWIERHS